MQVQARSTRGLTPAPSQEAAGGSVPACILAASSYLPSREPLQGWQRSGHRREGSRRWFGYSPGLRMSQTPGAQSLAWWQKTAVN